MIKRFLYQHLLIVIIPPHRRLAELKAVCFLIVCPSTLTALNSEFWNGWSKFLQIWHNCQDFGQGQAHTDFTRLQPGLAAHYWGHTTECQESFKGISSNLVQLANWNQ